MAGEHHPQKDNKFGPGRPEAKQLHFVVCCVDEQLQDLRGVISKALQAFHEKAAKKIRDGGVKRSAAEAGLAGAPGASPFPGGPPHGGGWAPPPQGPGGYPPPGAPWHPGYGPPPGRDPYAQHPGAPPGAAPPPGSPWGFPPPGQFPGGPPQWGAPPPGFPPAGLPPPGAPPASDQPAESPEDAQKEAPNDPAMQARIEHGKKLVKAGKDALLKGKTEKAYEKYCRGLQYLLDVMPKLSESRPKAQELRQHIHGYLDEAEKLKQKLDSGDGGAAAAAAAVMSVEATAPSKSAGAPPRALPRRGGAASKSGAPVPPADLAGPPPRRLRSHGAGDAVPPQDKENVSRMKRGEALVRDGKQAEEEGRLDEGYKKYCRGLQHLLEVMPKLGDDDPKVVALRAKLGGYLEQAERLKERLEGAGGAQKEASPPEPENPQGGSPPREGRRHRRHRRNAGGQDAEPQQIDRFEAPLRDRDCPRSPDARGGRGGRSRSPGARAAREGNSRQMGRGGASRSRSRRGPAATLRPRSGARATLRDNRGRSPPPRSPPPPQGDFHSGVPATRGKARGATPSEYPAVASKAGFARR